MVNNMLSWLLLFVLEENQYNIWVQTANPCHSKCKLQGVGFLCDHHCDAEENTERSAYPPPRSSFQSVSTVL